MRCATSSTCRGCGSCSSPSTAIPTIPISLKTMSTNTVVYTGTHDNPTTRGWFEDLPERPTREHLEVPRRRTESRAARPRTALMELAWSSIGCAGDGSAAGFAEPGQRGSNERSRPRRRQLALALHGGHAVRSGLRMAARSDERREPVESLDDFAVRKTLRGRIENLNAICGRG